MTALHLSAWVYSAVGVTGGCLLEGVICRGCVCRGGGVCPGACLPLGRVSQTTPPWTIWQTWAKTLPCPNYVVDGNKTDGIFYPSPRMPKGSITDFSIKVKQPVHFTPSLPKTRKIWHKLFYSAIILSYTKVFPAKDQRDFNINMRDSRNSVNPFEPIPNWKLFMLMMEQRITMNSTHRLIINFLF